MRPTAGIALGGRYRLDRQIAVGGMGEVWVAHDLSLGRDVAVKVLREEFAGDPGFLARFRTEARNAASLSHPNIAALFDYGEQSGSSYLVMELVTGEPLSDLLEREPVLPEARLLPVLAQTARALHAAHLAGVVHRDVKPGNILLGSGGRVKITDFGVSTAPDQAPMTATGMVMGTAQYLSPEQAVGRPATAASDLYSLGVVAYEALSGQRPFTGPTAVDIAVAHVNSPVPPLPPHVSGPTAALVMRLLAKEPSGRPATAALLARDLDALLGRTPPDGHELLELEHGPAPVAARPAPAPVPAYRSAAASRTAGADPVSRGGATAHRPATGRAARQDAPGDTAPPSIAPPSYPPRRDMPDPRGPVRPRAAVPPPGDAWGAAATRPAGPAAGGRPSSSGRPAPRAAPVPPAPPDGRSATRVTGTPVRTSTTTGRRLGRVGRLTWPLVALGLLLLTLLIAAVVDGASGSSAAHASPAAGPACACGAPGADRIGAMITVVPAAEPAGTDTPTAKDA